MSAFHLLPRWPMMILFWPFYFGIASNAFVMTPNQVMGTSRFHSLVTLSGAEGGDFIESWNEGGRVDVEVCKSISFPPGSFSTGEDPLVQASDCVRKAWVEYHWKKGGGLPIVILEKKPDNGTDNSIGTENFLGKRRVIAPVFMEETISSFPCPESSAFLELEYTVTSPGPFFGPDLVKGSHNGKVSFSSAYADISDEMSSEIITTLVWSVQFDAIRLLGLYQAVTEFTIGTAATTVQEAASMPRLFTIATRLPVEKIRGNNKQNKDDSAYIARSDWLDFLHSATGGGLPLLPPICFGEVLPEGGGIARKKRYLFPFVVETAMVDGPSTVDDGIATACYQLESPGWWTFPFLFHTHLGRVKFQETETMVDMSWEVQIRPYAFCAPLVEKMIEAVVTTIARNFRAKVEAPEAMVEIVPGVLVFPKFTWIGRVVEARTRDERPLFQRSISFLEPWTWGDSRTGRQGEDDVVFGWSDGRID